MNTVLRPILHHAAKQLAENRNIHGSKDIQHIVIGQYLSIMEGHALVKKTQRVTHGPVRRFGYIGQRLILHGNVLGLGQLLQMGYNGINRNPLKIIPLTS